MQKSLFTRGAFQGSYLKDTYRSDWRGSLDFTKLKDLPDPKQAREVFFDRERRDRMLRLTRRLRVGGQDLGGTLAEPEAWEVEREQTSYFHYTSYIIRGKADPFPRDSAGWWCSGDSHTSHVAGVGALILALRGVGQEPLRSQLVQQGLLLAKIWFRLTLASFDISWCKDLGQNASQKRRRYEYNGDYEFPNPPPHDLGYNFLLLERVLDDLGVEGFGCHEWFPLLALHSLDLQREDGGWYPWRNDRLVPTALHLLFLSRSQGPDLSDPLPTYKPAPVSTGPGRAAASPWQALVADRDGRHYRIAEVLASLKQVGKEERIRLASKGLDGLPVEDRRALAPLLEEIASEGPSPAKAWATKALAGMKGHPPAKPADPANRADR